MSEVFGGQRICTYEPSIRPPFQYINRDERVFRSGFIVGPGHHLASRSTVISANAGQKEENWKKQRMQSGEETTKKKKGSRSDADLINEYRSLPAMLLSKEKSTKLVFFLWKMPNISRTRWGSQVSHEFFLAANRSIVL